MDLDRRAQGGRSAATEYVFAGRVCSDCRARRRGRRRGVGSGRRVRAAAPSSPRLLTRTSDTVGFTHLDRIYWPEAGLTKGDLVAYYRAIAPVLLPHVRDRPFTIKRHYTVPRGPFVWEKDAPAEMPEWIRVAPQPAKSRRGAPVRYPLVNDERALLWMVEYGAVDLHVWTSRADRPDRPDYVLFDLDPARVPFAHVVRAALLLREALETVGLMSLVRTTGGAGLHVHVPIA